jgi:all-trans-retinol dehydrogenase (NAD+)
VLSHTKKARVAVLDLAPPTYAPAPPGAPEILYIKCDVTSPEQVHEAAEQIKAKFGRAPTFLINNAGVAAGNVILKTDIKLVEKVWKVSVSFVKASDGL